MTRVITAYVLLALAYATTLGVVLTSDLPASPRSCIGEAK